MAPRRSFRFWLVCSSLLLVLIYSIAIWLNQSMWLDGDRVFWLHDDMMISMRYARNLAQGEGLVWNPGGERVEGYSNFGWVLLMATVHLLPVEGIHTSLLILLVNMCLAIGVLCLSVRLMQILGQVDILMVIGLVVSLILMTDLARWTIIGLEVPLLTLVFLWFIIKILDENRTEDNRRFTFFLFGMLGIIRADGLIYIGLLCFFDWLLCARDKKKLSYYLLALILPGVFLAFRWFYYGDILPNTYYLKIAGWNLLQRFQAGFRYEARFLLHYGVLLLISGVGVWRSQDRRGRLLWLMAIPLSVYVIFIGGDDFSGARFFAPWLPVLLVLSFLTPRWLHWEAEKTTYYTSLCVLFVIIIGFTGYIFFGRGGIESRFIKAGLSLKTLTNQNTSIANVVAGTLPYITDLPSVDLLGKNDGYISHLPVRRGSNKPGHNKFDFSYSLSRYRPDLVVHSANPYEISRPGVLAEVFEGDDAYLGLLYQDPVFREQYISTLILIEGIPVFVRKDSDAQLLLAQLSCNTVDDPDLYSLGLRTICILGG